MAPLTGSPGSRSCAVRRPAERPGRGRRRARAPGWAAWPAGIRGASGWATRSPGLRPCAETRAAVQRARAGRWPARRHPRRRGPVCAPTQGAPATAESCPPCAPNSSTSEFPGKFWEESGRLLHLESLSWWAVQARPSLASELRSRGRACAARRRKHSAPCRGRK